MEENATNTVDYSSSINALANEFEAASPPTTPNLDLNAAGLLDDKLLDAVTPKIAILDEAVIQDEQLKPTICTRCRTISSSFLSSPYLTGSGGDNVSVDSQENRIRTPQGGRRQSEASPHLPRHSTLEDGDDVPLLQDEEGAETGLGGMALATSEHCHIPRTGHWASRHAMTKLVVACVLTTVFMIGEAIGGYLASSIAIMSDAAHLFSDLTSFIVSLVAIYLAMQPASKKMSFGYHRAEVLGAMVSVLIIWVITAVLVYAAVQRVISMDFDINADTMIIVSGLGVLMNIILGIVLHMGSGGHGHSHGRIGGHGHSHGGPQNALANSTSASEQQSSANSNINVRAAFIHVLGDLIQSIGVLIAAYVIRYYPQYKVADPICTFIFSVLVIITTLPILKDLGNVLMEGTPPGIDYGAVSSNLTALPGVKMVHSLHVWALTLDKNACAVHLAISSDSDPEVVLRDAQRMIRNRHHIFQTTIQVERYQPDLMDNCQQCQPLCR